MERKNGYERFSNGAKIVNFWQWAYLDLLCNTARGRLAEYIVAMALEVDRGVRTEWDAYDLLTNDNIKVEVKSSAYLQTWNKNELSDIRFDIKPTRLWDYETNRYSDDCKRHSEVYVFCLFDCKDREQADIMNLDLWKFYVVKTSELDQKVGKQKSISINSIQKLEHTLTNFDELNSAICKCFEP